MRVETRKTAAGTEYWDTVEKRTVFVPAGEDTDFEVTENPISMIEDKESEKDSDQELDPVVINFSKMTVPQLKEFATENGIDIPSEVTKKDDIIKLLTIEE